MWSLTPFLLAILTVACTARVHLPLVHHHLVVNHARIVLLLSCDAHTLHRSRRLAHRLNIWSSSLDIAPCPDAMTLDDPRPFHHPHHRIAVVLDLQCPAQCVRLTLAAMSRNIRFHRRFVWLLFAEDREHVERSLAGENVNVDAEITAATRANNVSADGVPRWDLWDVYNPSFARGGRLRVTHKQLWSSVVGAPPPPHWPSQYERRRNFGGLRLKGVLTVSSVAPGQTWSTYLERAENVQLDPMSRFGHQLFRLMETMHNFSIFVVRSQRWGTTDANGTWDGSIGFLTRNDVDMCMTPLRWSPERFGYYETTTYNYHVSVQFLFRHPRTSLAAGNVFLQPFVAVVWAITAALAVCSACAVRGMLRLENRHIDGGQPADDAWSNAMLTVSGILLQQGYDVEPRLMAARITVLAVLFLALMLLQFYGAFLVASLLMDPPKTIRTIRQLFDSGLECALDEVAYIRDIFTHLIDPNEIDLYQKRIVPTSSWVGQTEGQQRIKRGGFAFAFADISPMYTDITSVLSESEVCDLQTIRVHKPFACGPALPNRSPLQELVKINIRRMFETGLHSYHQAIWKQAKPQCAQSAVDIVPIDLEHFSSALYALAFGMTVSAVICAGEILFKLWQSRQHQHRLKE